MNEFTDEKLSLLSDKGKELALVCYHTNGNDWDGTWSMLEDGMARMSGFDSDTEEEVKCWIEENMFGRR